MHTNSNKPLAACATCATQSLGLCPTLFKILSEQLDSQFPRHFALEAGSHLYHQGAPYNGNYILKEGWILLSRLSHDGTRQVLRFVLPGDFLGFQPDLKGSHIDSAISLSNSVICSIPELYNTCSSHPELALRLAHIGANTMVKQELYFNAVVHKTARERIAFMALDLYLRLKLRGLNREYTIQFPLLQKDIADTLGLTSIHVSRTLKALKKDRLLMIEKHELTILDYDALFAMVGSQLEPMTECDIA